MASHHDTGYKELFSHPEFVEALFDQNARQAPYF